MTELTPEVRAALTSGNLAHFVTLNADGTPQTTVVWVGVRDDEPVIAHFGRYQKVRNIERDPRVSLSLLTGGRSPHGLDEYLVVEGTAYVTEGGAAELLAEFAPNYLGEGAAAPVPPNAPPGFITHIRVTRVTGIGPWGRDH
ncbi:MAG: putative F420-dependent enzyme [Acidimicrobiia bacterium]|nr:putative F420-dependent enzyme [Acidimicrobiia bacterium]